MRVFVTGASGWIGSAVVPELIGVGHQVLGLARSEATAKTVADMGAEVLRGDLNDIEILRSGARDSDSVIHLAYEHALGQSGGAQTDATAIDTFLDALARTGKRLVISGATLTTPGRPSTEQDELIAQGPIAARITMGCTNDLGQGLSTERICSCQSDAGSSARSSRLRRCRW